MRTLNQSIFLALLLLVSMTWLVGKLTDNSRYWPTPTPVQVIEVYPTRDWSLPTIPALPYDNGGKPIPTVVKWNGKSVPGPVTPIPLATRAGGQ